MEPQREISASNLIRCGAGGTHLQPQKAAINRDVGVLRTGGSPSSFCQMGVLDGFESTSHLSDTSMPSRNGYPKPGVREMANDGVSV